MSNRHEQGFDVNEFNEERMLEVTKGYDGKFSKLRYATQPNQISQFLKNFPNDISKIFANGIRKSWENDLVFKNAFKALHRNIKKNGSQKFQNNLTWIYKKSTNSQMN